MSTSRKNTANVELGFIGIAFVVLISMAVLAAIGYLVYQNQNTPSQTDNSNSGDSKSSSETNDDPSDQQSYITIPEWGVKAPYEGSDLSYTTISDNPNLIGLHSKQLGEVEGCEVDAELGNAGTIGRYLPTDNVSRGPTPKTAEQYLGQTFSTTPSYKKLGDYYFIYWDAQAECSDNTEANIAVRQAAKNIVENFESIP